MAQAFARSSFRARVERYEEQLSPLATRSYPALRELPEPDSDHRTPFQRDRDRIVHSKAFRRLKHKTQVFIAPEGDHYRTRLTHTLEACGIARNVARALGLNEDLTEAIGLGHDLGHPPFGHVGEAVLDSCGRGRWGHAFRHNEHSLRVVERIERLNLTEPVREGILRHTGPSTSASLEGRIVLVVDRIDRSEEAGDIVQGEEVGGAMLRLREFMFERVYLAPDAQPDKPHIEGMLRALFDHYVENPPPPLTADASDEQRVVDWLAGMTDRFAIKAFVEL